MPLPGYTDPYAGEASEIERRRRYADMLREQSGQPIQSHGQGGVVAPISWTQGAAKLLQGYNAGAAGRDAEQRAKALRERVQGDRTSDMSALATALRGSPGGMQADAADNVTQMPGRPAGQLDPAIMGQLKSPDMQNMAMQMFMKQMQPQKPMVVGRSLLDPASGKVVGQDATWQAEQEAMRGTRQSEAEARRQEAQRSEQARFDQQRRMAQLVAGMRQPNQEQIINTAEGPMRIVGGQAVPITGPGGAQVKPAAGRGGQMTATAQKELIETEEQLQGGQSALDLFKQARSINDKAMGFTGAGALASAGTLLPDALRPAAVDATQNLDNILQTAALPQLKAIFGGMPTEGERKILLDVQGSSSKPPAVRKQIFDRAEKAIQARITFANDKAKRLREGTYFSGEGLPSLKAPTVNPQDAAALEWANANPNDPRAAKIKQRLGQ